MVTCSVCGTRNPEGARFCFSCGGALSAASRREERKIVSVLFADLVGFTSRAEQLDPEDVRAVLAPYWERLRGELERMGGTVEKFIGDAVMALFGAPVTREDDPERAVRAALAIRDWAREEPDLQVRIAVTTGEALVVLGARPAQGEGMAAGDVVNTAARLQAAAPVNGILVAESTYRATRDVIDYEEREPVTAKGKTEPVRVWEAVQAHSRPGMDLEQRAALPLVGRVRELESLAGAFGRACGEREPQLVTLVGVPGIGKSRLVAEFYARLDEGPDIVWWRQGRALPYGDGVSFWAVVEMVKAQAGIQENDSVEEARAKVWASLESAVPAPDRLWIAQHLLPLVGLSEIDVSGRREESFAAWRRYFECLAEQRPLVLAFEDLHWADDGLLDFVDHLAEWASGVPLLVVGTARPELLDRRPGWGGGKLNAATVALAPLADDEAAQIIAGVLGRAPLPADAQRELLERAGGNPLYAEQFARLYAERGSADELPESIQGIIAARLDGLTADEKLLIQNAAVLGKIFWVGAVAELSGLEDSRLAQALHALERKGLIRRERRSAVAGEEEYAFRHVLVRDVAYGQIPRAERGRKHSQAAGWIESLGRTDDHAELIAHHCAAALELGRAAGGGEDALEERARWAFRRAGDRARRLSAFSSAEHFYADALSLWPEDEQRPHVQLGHAQARFRARGVDDELTAAVAALEDGGQVEAAAEAVILSAHAAWRGGRQAEARDAVARARSMLEGRPPSRALAEALAESARIAVFDGDPDEGIELTAEALRLAEEMHLDELRASVLNTRGVMQWLLGDLRTARETFLTVVRDELSRSSELARAYMNLSVIESADGYSGLAAGSLEHALEAALRIGDRAQLVWIESAIMRSGDYAEGRWDKALVRADAFLDEVAAAGGHYLESAVLIFRAKIFASRGDRAAAERDLAAGLAKLDPVEDLQTTVPNLIEGAYVKLLLGDLVAAGEYVDIALPHIARTRFRAPPVTAGEAVAVVRTGRTAEFLAAETTRAQTGRVWAAHLVYVGQTVDAAELYAQIASPEEEAVTRLLAAEQLAEAGRLEEADAQLQRALGFYRAVGATAIVRQAESLLAAAS